MEDKMSWPAMTVNSWEDFVEEALKFSSIMPIPPEASYVFRGQSIAGPKYTLQPSLLRKVKNLDRKKAIGVEMLLLGEFMSQAFVQIPLSLIPNYNETVTWWILMQQYGAPTRLLDWTQSLYVAAYFAVEADINEDGAIWYFSASNINEKNLKLNYPIYDQIDWRTQPLLGDLPWFYPIRAIKKFDRLIAQQGLFTIAMDVLEDHADIIERTLDNDKDRNFGKIIIPAKLKPRFLLELHRLNVNAAALFPGLDGLGRSLSELATIKVNDD
jgi:hypothetical protein